MSEHQIPQLDAPISCPVIEQLLVMLVRNKSLFNSANTTLSPQHFNHPNEVAYQSIWWALQEYYKLHNDLPNKVVLEAEAVNLLADSLEYSEQNEKELTNLLTWIFDENENPVSSFDINHGQHWLKQLLMDRRVGDPLRNMGMPGRVANLPRLLEKSMSELRQINTISSAPQVDTIPEDWGAANPTGPPLEFDLNFVDGYMNTVPNDVNILLGGTGGGKTMLFTQMLTASARVQRRKVMRGGTGKLCAYFGYEGESRDPRIRVMSYAAKIMKKRLEAMRNYTDLSTTANLADYERKQYKYLFGSGPPIGEQERLEKERDWLNQYLRIYDFAGNKGADGVSRGFGGIAEIRQTLDNEIDRSQMEIGVVFIDWAGMVLRRYIEAIGRSVERNLTHELNMFVDKVHSEIAQPFNCTVFIAHQLKGIINKNGPTYIPMHADAEYCSAFGSNAWFAMTLGAKDEITNALTLSYTKTRRGEGKKGLVLLLNGDFAHFEDASNRFRLDRSAKKIVDVNVNVPEGYQQYENQEEEDDLITTDIDNYG